MAQFRIEEGNEVFLHDGEAAFGSVLHAPPAGADELVIFVEDAGEFRIPMTAVKAVHDGKVLLNKGLLGVELLEAIGHAHDEEDARDHLEVDDTDTD